MGSEGCLQAADVPSLRADLALDWRIVLLENLIAYGGKATTITLTPPGKDRLRGTDRSARTRRTCAATGGTDA